MLTFDTQRIYVLQNSLEEFQMDDMDKSNERLQALMAEKDLNNTDVAEIAGVGLNQVARWLKGASRLRADQIRLICQKYNISANWLVGLRDQQFDEPSPALAGWEVQLLADARRLGEEEARRRIIAVPGFLNNSGFTYPPSKQSDKSEYGDLKNRKA